MKGIKIQTVLTAAKYDEMKPIVSRLNIRNDWYG